MSKLAPHLPAVLFDWERQFPGRTAWEEEGALAFFDVSGFTAMSERLAKLGREGAEVVTDVIGSTFEQLLAVAYEAGGSLLKFGGDALLVYFNGDDAARRACQAAGRMRAALRQIGAIQTPMGAVRLRMSAGVHAGTFQFFLAGSPTRELLVCSPGASRVAEMEKAASAGEILVSPETAAMVGSRWMGAASGPGVLLASPPPGGTRVEATLPDHEGVDLASLLPSLVRDAVLSGGDDPEHRHVAVGFVHFDGTDALIAREGLEEAGSRLHELVTVVHAACDEFGVALLNSDVDIDGGKFLLCAGAPVAAADADERLLRALRSIVEARPPVSVRAGANRGLLFAGSIGPSYRRSYTLMGDVVNTAARVMSNARRGEVLTLKPVLDGARSRFAVRRLPPFAAKGKSRPMVAYRVGAPTGDAVDQRTGGRFIGREKESARLDALIASAREGGADLLEIRGDLGVGKTRLVAEARGRADDVVWVQVAGEPYRASSPYFPWHRLIRSLLPMAPEADLPLLRIAAGLDSEGLADVDQRVFRSRMHAAVTSLLDAAWGDTPTVVVIDEAQWLDDGSAALARHLGWAAQSRRWALVALRWGDEGPALTGNGVGNVVALEPLPRHDAEELVADRSLTPLLPQHVERLVERAAGNPLFLEQLVASFDADDEESLPAGLEALVSARIDRLSAVDRTALRSLSVLGTRFDGDGAAVVLDDHPVLDLRELGQAMAEFVEVDVASRTGWFRQGVFQSVAYAGLAYRRRRELHGRFASYVEARDGEHADAALLATHFRLAQQWEPAWRYGLAAGRHAVDQYAFEEAAELFAGALKAAARLGRRGVDRVELLSAWMGYGDALRQMGRLADAAAPYTRARRLLEEGDVEAEVRLCLVEGDLAVRQGRLSSAVRWLRRGLKVADGAVNDTEEVRKSRVRLLALAGRARLDQGRHAEARRLLKRAMDESEATGDVAGLAHACLWLSYSYNATGSPGQDELAERALALYRQLDAKPWEGAALNALGVSAKSRGQWDEALALLERASTMLRAGGDPVSAAIVEFNIGDVMVEQGRGEDAAAIMERVVRTFRAARHAYTPIAESLAAAARAQTLTGGAALEAISAEVLRATSTMRERGMTTFVRESEVRWAEACLRAGDVASAAAFVDASPAGMELGVEAQAARVRSTIAWRRGDVEAAREAAEEALELASKVGSAHGVALAQLLLADLPGSTSRRTDAEVALARLGVVTSSRTVWREPCTDQSS